MRCRLRAAACALVVVVSDCTLNTESQSYTRQPAVIDIGGSDSVKVTIPATASIGTAVNVIITTYGGDCILQGDTPVSVNGLTAEIRPHDVFHSESTSAECTRKITAYAHTAAVAFTQAGTATIRIFGRKDPGRVDISVERTIQVH